MTVDTLGDIARWATVVLAFVSCAALLASIIRHWDTLSDRIRRLGLGVCLLLAANAYSAGEAATSDVPVGIRTFLILFSMMALALSIFWDYNEDMKDQRD